MSVLKGNKSFYDYEVSDTLAYNLKCWLEYGLLEMGAYTRVNYSLPTSGYTNLKRVNDDRYGNNRVFEGLGAGWVWENDVSPIAGIPAPFVASGIHVNNTFYPTATTSGTYGHIVDFRTGRVIFNNSIPSSASVSCEYTFRNIGVYLVDEPQYKTIIERYLEQYQNMETLAPKGLAQKLKEDRVILPSVVVEVGDRTNEPLQLGGGEINSFSVEYHIFSDNSFTNRRLCDVLNNQYQTTLDLFDVNNLQFPYNYDGSLASGALTYPNLGSRNSPYFWEFARIEATDGGPQPSDTDVHRAEVRHTIGVDRHLITY